VSEKNRRPASTDLERDQPAGASSYPRFDLDKPQGPAISMRAAVHRLDQCAAGQFEFVLSPAAKPALIADTERPSVTDQRRLPPLLSVGAGAWCTGSPALGPSRRAGAARRAPSGWPELWLYGVHRRTPCANLAAMGAVSRGAVPGTKWSESRTAGCACFGPRRYSPGRYGVPRGGIDRSRTGRCKAKFTHRT
jgi:hypothetical protein